METVSFAKLGELIGQAGHIVILTHKNPDGDALGASLGLYHYMRSQGKLPRVVVPNDFPDFLSWMPGASDIMVYFRQKKSVTMHIARAELILCLDFNALPRAEELEPLINESAAKRILIDHHPDPSDFAHYGISDVSYCATAEIILDFLLSDKKYQLTKEAAECLYTGIMTDTGCFSYNSSNPRTYRLMSRMLESGLDKDRVYSAVFDNYSEHRMRLLGHCLSERMKVIPEWGTAYIWLTAEDMIKYQFQPGDSEGFVNYPLSIKGIRFSALFTEKDGKIRISFRSRGSFPTNLIASEHFRGGGHLNASGGESQEPLLDTIRKFEKLLPAYFG